MAPIGNICFVLLISSCLLSSLLAEDITTGSGIPVPTKSASITVGPQGPLTLDNLGLMEDINAFIAEKIPVRVVHSKGTGAFGYFNVTNDITQYCGADLFSDVGKITKVGVRFSLAAGDVGGPDSARALRGFAVKFYTNEGNWDLIGVHMPTVFIRDGAFFAGFVHALNPQPGTNLMSNTALMDIATLRPESIGFLIQLFSDRGTPDGYRHMNGHSVNTFKLVNNSGESVYCRFNLITDQGIKNLTSDEASQLSGSDPSSATRDLRTAILSGDYPSWTMKMQIATEEQFLAADFNLFDTTKEWPEDTYPNIEVGKLVLNENPQNYFSQIEQMALTINNMVPGIRPSYDKMLQSRLLTYDIAQRYRIGTNFQQLPVNRPISTVRNYQRDGKMRLNNQGNATSYFPNSFDNLTISERAVNLSPTYTVNGVVAPYEDTDADYSQVTAFYDSLSESEKATVANNFGGIASTVDAELQARVLDLAEQVSSDLADRMRTVIGV